MIEGAPPRLFALPPGADFPAGLVEGLAQRLDGAPPEAWGRVTLLVNSGRMLRRVRAALDAGPARLLPRMLLVSDLDPLARGVEAPAALAPLSLTLHLARMLEVLIARDPTLAPRAALFDLARSLAALIDEMEGEGAGGDTLERIDAGPFAAHWQRSEIIVRAAYEHFARLDGLLPGGEARRRRLVDGLVAQWAETPPPGPILIAGSTGSRGTTRRLMAAVARLQNGAVILPGYDFAMPPNHWRALDRHVGVGFEVEDHPQFRFRALMQTLGLGPEGVLPWSDTPAPDPARNALVSLALCPAPVTDRWRAEGAALGDPVTATQGMSLIEAPTPRQEAGAIALAIRVGLEDGRRTALVTPDRELTRQVAARLTRWGISPDDSAGTPLHQTPPGRMLRLVAGMMARPPDLPVFLSLLKHPLTASGAERGAHLLAARGLELFLRRESIVQPDTTAVRRWDDAPAGWVDWVCGWLDVLANRTPEAQLETQIATQLHLAETVARGPDGTGPGGLWDEEAGRAAQAAMADLSRAAGAYDGPMPPRAYGDLVLSVLQARQVLDPRRPHPGVMIWGTLEARVQGADRVILAGLNEGVWPAAPAPDPWLNRAMRQTAGLLSPERAIGLSAHDFQQAIGAQEVILTRARRDAEAPTIPSRWLNRLTNLLRGLGDGGKEALSQMENRGALWVDLAVLQDAPDAAVAGATRPSPRPPLGARPKQLSVTRVTTLVRDPYAIYAQYVLGLRPLNPLLPQADMRARGMALHDVMEAFLASRSDWRHDVDAARASLLDVADMALAKWSDEPAIRALWRARLTGVAERLAEREIARLAEAEPVLTEDRGRLPLPDLRFTLTATPDRIDRFGDGSYAVRDYKTGQPPTDKEVRYFDRQLPLTAAMLERGGFAGLEAGPVQAMEYITLGRNNEDRTLAMEQDGTRVPDLALADLERLLTRYADRALGYTAQRAAARRAFGGDYDHLSRFGEWDLTDPADPVDVGPPEEPEDAP